MPPPTKIHFLEVFILTPRVAFKCQDGSSTETTVTSQETHCKFPLPQWQAPATTFKGVPVAKIITGVQLSKQESSYKRLVFECSTSTVTMLKAFVNGMPCHSDYWECSTQVSMETWEIDVKFVGSVWHQGMELVASQPSLTTGILILNHGDGIKSPQLMMKLCEMVTFTKQWQKEEARMYWRTFILMVLLSLEREEYPHLCNEETPKYSSNLTGNRGKKQAWIQMHRISQGQVDMEYSGL